MTIVVLLGPTSSGKTGLGLELGSLNPKLELISADSRQVFKYMDVGTGKVPQNSALTVIKNDKYWLINGVKVWGYDLVSPAEYFSAYDYTVFAKATIAAIYSRGNCPLIIGGTGFFIDALTGRLNLASAEPNFGLRKELNELTLEQALSRLKALNESDYYKIDQRNKIRVIRAIERNMLPQVEMQPTSGLAYSYFGLVDERQNLYDRVDKWAECIWGEALFEELRVLDRLGYKDTPPLKGLVYKTATAYLMGDVSFSEGLVRLKFDLHAYIRRQQTWFKKNDTITWLQVSERQANLEKLGNALTLG